MKNPFFHFGLTYFWFGRSFEVSTGIILTEGDIKIVLNHSNL